MYAQTHRNWSNLPTADKQTTTTATVRWSTKSISWTLTRRLVVKTTSLAEVKSPSPRVANWDMSAGKNVHFLSYLYLVSFEWRFSFLQQVFKVKLYIYTVWKHAALCEPVSARAYHMNTHIWYMFAKCWSWPGSCPSVMRLQLQFSSLLMYSAPFSSSSLAPLPIHRNPCPSGVFRKKASLEFRLAALASTWNRQEVQHLCINGSLLY